MTEHEGEFKKIEEEDEAIGPGSILIGGFGADLLEPLGEVMATIGLPDHRLLLCTAEMVKQPLEKALSTTEPGEPAAPDALPRVMILSGMTGEQIQAFLAAHKTSGLPRPIFAAVTPINLTFPVGKLIMELLREQREMSRRR